MVFSQEHFHGKPRIALKHPWENIYRKSELKASAIPLFNFGK